VNDVQRRGQFEKAFSDAIQEIKRNNSDVEKFLYANADLLFLFFILVVAIVIVVVVIVVADFFFPISRASVCQFGDDILLSGWLSSALPEADETIAFEHVETRSYYRCV
jgi:hypothetical protein